MVIAGSLALPFAAVFLLWFVSTGLVAMLNHRLRASLSRALTAACLCAFAGLALIVVSTHSAEVWAVYASFLGGLLIWSWHEIAFLTGAVAGPNTLPCPPGVRGWRRFSLASMALIHHEVALAMTAGLMLTLAAATANATGAYAFALLFAYRLSSKLNLYWGVPHLSDELLPRHLDHLKSYFGPRRMTLMLPLTIAAIAAVATAFGWSALTASTPGAAAQAALLCCLSLLGAIEHLFLALPFRDSALWGWAMERHQQNKTGLTGGE
ncbi:putative photosynthetic complex assembly protein PuhE [Sphingomonas sp. CJ99]